jgi:hypothetical protein
MKKLLATLALAGLALTGCSTAAPAPTPTVTVTQTPEPAPTVTVTPEPEVTETQGEHSRVGKGAMTDAEFVKFIRDARPAMSNVTDENIVGLADSTCRAFDRGASFTQVIQAVTNNSTGEVAKSIGFTIGAGVRIYCPEYVTKVEGS